MKRVGHDLCYSHSSGESDRVLILVISEDDEILLSLQDLQHVAREFFRFDENDVALLISENVVRLESIGRFNDVKESILREHVTD